MALASFPMEVVIMYVQTERMKHGCAVAERVTVCKLMDSHVLVSIRRILSKCTLHSAQILQTELH